MSYLLQLIPTRAGYALENAAQAGDGPAPRLDRMIVGGGAPLSDPASATADNIGMPLAVSVQAMRMAHSADAITGEAGFPEAGTYTITWAALLFDDGTPAAYGAFTAPFEKGAGWAFSLEWVLSRAGVGDLALTVNILDINALRAQLYNAVRADLDANNLGIAETRIKPVERAMHHVLRDGNPLMHLELFADPYNLRGGNALAISGVIAGDDSIDLAEHTETLLSGDYLIFGGGNTETVRLLANLELGRRRLQSDILHTYPTATLSRTNWTITAGEAIAAAGQVYYSKPLALADNSRTQRVIIRALSAAAAPIVAMRADAGGGYIDGMLVNTRPAADGSAGYSDYLYDVRCTDAVGHLRITTPAATRVRAVVVANIERALSIYDIAADPEQARLRYERGGFLGIFGSGEFVSLTTPGPGVFIVPPGVSSLRVRTLGPGGPNLVESDTSGRGGNGGGWALGIIDVAPGDQIPYVVGVGTGSETVVGSDTTFGNSNFGPMLFGQAGRPHRDPNGNLINSQRAQGGGTHAQMSAQGGISYSRGGAAAGSQLGRGGDAWGYGGAAVGGSDSQAGELGGASLYGAPRAGYRGASDFFGGNNIVGSAGQIRRQLRELNPRFPGDWFPGGGGDIVFDMSISSTPNALSPYNRNQTYVTGGPGAGGAGIVDESVSITIGADMENRFAGAGGDFGGGGGGRYGQPGGLGGVGGGSCWRQGFGGPGLIVIEW